jgi:hypothetical protein
VKKYNRESGVRKKKEVEAKKDEEKKKKKERTVFTPLKSTDSGSRISSLLPNCVCFLSEL